MTEGAFAVCLETRRGEDNPENSSRGSSRIEEILSVLRAFGERPGMYVQPVSVDTVESFLLGLRIGGIIAGIDVPEKLYQTAAESRGWTWRALGIVWGMRRRGLSDELIIGELIEIEREFYQRARRTLE